MKNINSTHRVEGIDSQFGLTGALAASKTDTAANRIKIVSGSLGDQVQSALKAE